MCFGIAHPDSAASAAVWAAVETEKIEGLVSAHAITTIHYLVQKSDGAARARRHVRGRGLQRVRCHRHPRSERIPSLPCSGSHTGVRRRHLRKPLSRPPGLTLLNTVISADRSLAMSRVLCLLAALLCFAPQNLPAHHRMPRPFKSPKRFLPPKPPKAPKVPKSWSAKPVMPKPTPLPKPSALPAPSAPQS